MYIDVLLNLCAIIGSFFLGLFTFSKNPKSITNRLFFAFSLSLISYIGVNYLALHQSSDEATLFFVRSIITVAVIINMLFYFLVVAFPQPTLKIKPAIMGLILATTTLLIPLSQSPFIFQSIKKLPNNIESVPGPGIIFFLLHTSFLLGSGLITLVLKFRNSKGTEKNQLRLLLFGTTSLFISILFFNILSILLFNNSAFVGMLPLYILLFVGFISYAIVKHKFLDIQFLVARTVSFSLILFIIGFGYATLVSISFQLISGVTLDQRTLLISALFALIIAFSFPRLQLMLEKITDRIFYRNKYDINQLLFSLNHIMASTLKLEDLTHALLQNLITEIRCTSGAFILFKNNKIYDVAHEGRENLPEIDEEQILNIFLNSKIHIFDEMPESPEKDIMRNLKLAVTVHLQSGAEHIGLLVLGEKQSGDIYRDEDIRFLEIFAPEAAVALQNAAAYEEIRRFAITLQEQVNIATADLQRANEQLKQLDKLKDEFVSVTSHELRTPMTAIKSYTWMVLHDKAGPLEPKAREYLDRVYISTERLINLVNEMLNVSRIEGGRIIMNIAPFDLQSLINDITQEFAAKATERQMQVLVESNESFSVQADREKMQQVMENLIGNAFKYTPDSGTITIRTDKTGNMIRIMVKDTGVGMRKEDQGKLFTKFGRLGNPMTVANESSTGLGLFICKQFIELCKGKIWVESEEGKGSTFYFTIPEAHEGVISEHGQLQPVAGQTNSNTTTATN